MSCNQPSTQSNQESPETDISVIVPALNEQGNVSRLYERLTEALSKLNVKYEVIFVDDGSTDNTSSELDDIAKQYSNVKVIHLVRNFGQTAAFSAGIDHAKGQILVTLDADLQNDPKDIASLLNKLQSGFDVVSGWRKQRNDPFWTRVLPSWCANKIISFISGISLHDYGCSLKAYRRDTLAGVKLYGEMHRFIPIYAAWMGARIAEVPVTHHKRSMGSSKYGLSRSVKVILDLLTIKFLFDYGTKPSYVFGTLGLTAIALSFVSLAWALVLKYAFQTSLIKTPLPLLAVLLFTVGVQLVLMGLLAEVMVRTYHEAQGKRIYVIKDTRNI
ncbi:MAG: glycosyltransferase family 2 protein [Candidatus Melainabacteria bacterium]|nr:glycosyltransferase family 2 protein [Candidatus Melainabacteria bacterium]